MEIGKLVDWETGKLVDWETGELSQSAIHQFTNLLIYQSTNLPIYQSTKWRNRLKRICVYCGSSPGARPEYIQAARQLGHALASRDIGLVYGGGRVGVMGEIADAVLEAGGEVIGVIPRELVDKEVAFTALSDLRVVSSMHERKALMVELSDGFVALPGGLGTFEEFLEVLTWAQLNIHHKPCGLLNVCGYYTSLIGFLDHAVAEQFLQSQHRSMLVVDESPTALLDRFEAYQAPKVDKAAWALQMARR
jgi:uncharacterized protein (TIGR00730 family)